MAAIRESKKRSYEVWKLNGRGEYGSIRIERDEAWWYSGKNTLYEHVNIKLKIKVKINSK